VNASSLVAVALFAVVSYGEAPYWVWPPARSFSLSGKRMGPCGDSSSRGGTTTTIHPGPLTVSWEEPVNNIGSQFRISLSREGTDEFETCVMVDHIPHNDASDPSEQSPTKYSLTVDIPDINCDDCSLQLVNIVPGELPCTYDATETMNGLGGRCSTNFHSCANVKVVGGTYDRSSYTCSKSSDWPYNGNKYDQLTATWYQKMLMDPLVPASYRSSPISKGHKEGTVRSVISNQYDDAMENLANDKLMRTDDLLEFSSKRVIGLRFRDIPLPMDMDITDARLSLWFTGGADDNSTDSNPTPVGLSTFSISVELTSNSQPIEKEDKDITNRIMGQKQAVGHVVAQQTGWWTSPDLKELIQEVVEVSGFDTGNAMTVLIDVEQGHRSVSSFNGGHPPELSISYREKPVVGKTDPPTPAPSVPLGGPCTYGERDRVLGNYMNRGDWYSGRIETVYENSAGIKEGCLYDLVYDDGDSEMGVGNDRLTPETSSSRTGFQLREVVDVMRKGVWRRGMVRILQKSGAYTVEDLTTGDVYIDVDSNDMRQWVEYRAGDRVEIKQCWWFKSAIQKVLPDGRYECIMDDGYFANVVYPDIREIIDVRYVSGDAVKLFINQQWVEGFVIMPNLDGTYMVGVSGTPRIEPTWPSDLMVKTTGSG